VVLFGWGGNGKGERQRVYICTRDGLLQLEVDLHLHLPSGSFPILRTSVCVPTWWSNVPAAIPIGYLFLFGGMFDGQRSLEGSYIRTAERIRPHDELTGHTSSNSAT